MRDAFSSDFKLATFCTVLFYFFNLFYKEPIHNSISPIYKWNFLQDRADTSISRRDELENNLEYAITTITIKNCNKDATNNVYTSSLRFPKCYIPPRLKALRHCESICVNHDVVVGCICNTYLPIPLWGPNNLLNRGYSTLPVRATLCGRSGAYLVWDEIEKWSRYSYWASSVPTDWKYTIL